MKSLSDRTRALLTIFGFAAFGTLALGSDGCGSKRDPILPPAPQEVGHERALSWAKTSSADLAKKMQEIESERGNAQSEVYRLEALEKQFPDQASDISGTVKEWQQVVIELNTAMTAAEDGITKAYVLRQTKGKAGDGVLEEVYDQWSPKADEALALARRQRSKSEGSGKPAQ